MNHDRAIPGACKGAPARFEAFTLIELLVVITIILVLVTMVVTVGSRVLENSRSRNTAATLTLVQQAVDAFQADRPPLISARQPAAGGARVRYESRYGEYPPDELEPFTNQGLVGSLSGGSYSLYPGRVNVVPDPTTGTVYGPMEFRLKGLGVEELAQEHRDQAAMLLALGLSSSAQGFIDKIPDRYRSEGAVDPGTGTPVQYLDRNGNQQWDANQDLQIRYIVDDWDVPIVYYSQRDWHPSTAAQTQSTNDQMYWNPAATGMVTLNGGKPVIMSFGPDGKDQLEDTTSDRTVLLHVDWVENQRIMNTYHDDNIYADSSLADKLRQGDLQ
ncbi:MAG: prepilin-type N-terminal cleavage/methylation domain-containing protein [Phycisphaerales bacterium]|nr:MAG: prepilin-type N-terminal cleavage/methylation domain-containing protein [Phycisphaerales bacterium]